MKKNLLIALLTVSVSINAVTNKSILESIFRELDRVFVDVDGALGKICNIQKNDIEILAQVCELVTAENVGLLESKACSIASQVDELLGCQVTKISSPGAITMPGTYQLCNNVSDAITIEASDVTLDLNGFGVTNGIAIDSGLERVTLKNGYVDAGTADDAILAGAGSAGITVRDMVVKNGTRGINFDNVTGGMIASVEMTLNTTGLELDSSHKITVKDCVASCNTHAGYCLLSSTTNCFENCKAMSTGEGNTNEFDNNVFGFVSADGYANIFERCIANGTQALSTTDSNSVVAGFALRGQEGCTKIIDSESANATVSENGVTVPYGILLENRFDTLLTKTESTINVSSYRDVAWSPDGSYLAAVGSGATGDINIFSFDYQVGRLDLVAVAEHGADVRSVSWSQDGRSIAIGGALFDGVAIKVFSFDARTQTLSLVAENNLPTATVFSVSWSDNGLYLLSGEGSIGPSIGTIRVLKFDDARCQLMQQGSIVPGNVPFFVQWRPGEPNTIAAGVSRFIPAFAGSVQVYSFDQATGVLTLEDEDAGTSPIATLSWGSNGKYLAVGAGTSATTKSLEIYRYDSSSSTLSNVTTVPFAESIVTLDWAADNVHLVAGTSTAFSVHLYAFDAATESVSELDSRSDEVLSLRWAPDGSCIAGARAVPDDSLVIYSGLTFPSKNVIMHNMVYCNSGGVCPQGVGISGSSIYNVIIGNMAYSNPIPRTPTTSGVAEPIVGSNYQFVTNIFNQLFAGAPSDLQNISIDGCDPTSSPEDIALLLKQSLYKVCVPLESQVDALNAESEKICDISTKLDLLAACDPTAIESGPFTITQPGFYCLTNSISGGLTIAASGVVLDLNTYTATDGIVVNAGLNQIAIKNGSVDAGTVNDGILVNAGATNITISDVVTKNAVRGINFENVTGGTIAHCEMTLNTTGLELDGCAKINVQSCVASCNTHAGYCLLSSTTNCFENCKALSTGEGNVDVADTSIFGFVSADGYGNIFERCIANSTQGLSVAGSDSLVAGFALRGDEGCSKIIECESANATVNANGVTVPHGILLEGTFDGLTTLTEVAAVKGDHKIYDISWSSDGKYFAVASFDTDDAIQIFSYDYQKNQAQFVVQGDVTNLNNVRAVAWHPDGVFVAYSGGSAAAVDEIILAEFNLTNNTLKIVDTVAWSTGANDDVYSLNWSKDGKYLAAGGIESTTPAKAIAKAYEIDRTAKILTERGSILTTATVPNPTACFSVDWISDGNFLALGNRASDSSIGELAVYSFDKVTKTFSEVDSINFGAGNDDNIDSVAWAPSGKYVAALASGTGDGLRIYLFNGESLVFKDSVGIAGQTASSGYRSEIEWSADGKLLAVGGITDPTMQTHVYEFDQTTEALSLVAAFTDTVLSSGIAWSPDGSVLAVGRQSDGPFNIYMFKGIQFPAKNLIKNNTVYCNSGGSCPQGVGISGSSIQNMVIGNTCYSNPIPSSTGPIVASNYQFVTNVFNQLFGQVPSALQNISLDGCDPICQPEDANLTLKQALYKVCMPIQSQIDLISTKLDNIDFLLDQSSMCDPTPISSAGTISTAGSYCVINNITGALTIAVSDVHLDLNNYKVTEGITVNAGLDQVAIKNGVVEAGAAADAILVNAGSRNITIEDVTVKNGTRGINFEQVTGGTIANCQMTLNTTGLELDGCAKINVKGCVTSCNTHAGYCLLSSTTNCFENCKALSTGEGNFDEFDTNVFGFVSADGYGNIFERCIANSTQALSTTDSNSLVAGFALRGDEGCTKIIECESANSMTNENGFTVPHGILLEARALDFTESVTGALGTEGDINAVVWSPDGKHIAVAARSITAGTGDQMQILAFDRNAATLTPIAGALTGTLLTIDWSPDGNYLAVGGNGLSGSQEFQLYRFDKINSRLTFVDDGDVGTAGTVHSVRWSADGRYIVIGGASLSGGGLKVYRFDSAMQKVTLLDELTPPNIDGVFSVDWSPDGQYLAVGSFRAGFDEVLFVYSFDQTSGIITQELDLITSFVSASIYEVAWSPNGRYLAIVIEDSMRSTLEIFEFQRDPLSLTLIAGAIDSSDTFLAGSVAWSADNRYVAIGGSGITSGTGDDLQVYEFDASAQSLTAVTGFFSSTVTVNSVSWSPDGAYLVVGGETMPLNDVQIFEVLQFPSKNVIKDNTVYCNSGGNCPQGVGISGSSIQNMIIGNTAYSNPMPRTPATAGVAEPLVASNYQFITNVFDQRFGTAPIDLQNKSLDGCAPICKPADIPLLQKQNNFLLLSAIDLLLGHL